ncbi:hypothetical protein BURK1_03357 [Burkholderiales bacterium]|nr:hypothetical protein BURK1_03357 [Burkholderiales bacterium]
MSNRTDLGTAYGRIPWPVFESGLWLRLAISGAIVAILGPVLVVTGDTSPLAGAAMSVASGAVAVLSWRRMNFLLVGKRDTKPETAAAAATRTPAAAPRYVRAHAA